MFYPIMERMDLQILYGNGKVEAWIKVITPNEIEGWSRLSYIYPKEYENKEYKIIQSNQ